MRQPLAGLAVILSLASACSSSTQADTPSPTDAGTSSNTGGNAGAAGGSADAALPGDDASGASGTGGTGAGSAAGGAGVGGEAGEGGTGEGGTGEGGTSAAGDVGIYGICHQPGECSAGLTCTTVVQQPSYGQCTHDCVTDEDCEASPAGNPVGCHPEAKICLSLCGVYGGDCPEGLVCTAHEVCLEPSEVEATKGPGEHCTGTAECLGESECVEGENTSAYCAPLCETNEDCAAAAPGSSGQCIDASGLFKFCMFFCGMMGGGATCPGDLECQANTVCQ